MKGEDVKKAERKGDNADCKSKLERLYPDNFKNQKTAEISDQQKDNSDNLIENERKFRSIFDNVNDIIVFVSKTGRILELNRKIKDILGYEPDELIGKNFLTCGILAVRNASMIIKLFTDAVLRGGFPDKKSNLDITQVWLNHKDGQVVEVEASTTPIRKNRKIEGFISILRDITERKKAEQKVSNLKDFYGLILNNVHDGIWVTDKNDRLNYINPGMEKIAGVKAKDVLGLNVIRDFPPETTSELLKFYEKARFSLKSQEYEANVITPTGRRTIQTGWLIPRIKDKKYDGMICTIQDITERKKAEDALQTSQRQLSEALKIAKLGYWEYDVNEKMFTFNDQFYSVYRTSAEKAGGYKLAPEHYAQLFLFPDYIDEFCDMMKKIREDNNIQEYFQDEHRVKFGDGKTGYVSVSFFVIRDEHGHQVEIYGANQDITERKLAEQAMMQSEEKFRTLFNNAQVGMFRCRLDGSEFLESNEKYLSILGMTREDVIGKPTVTLYANPKEQEEMVEILKAKGKVSNFDCRITSKTGEVKDCITSLKLDPETGILDGSIIDNTERKKAQEALIASEAKYKALFDNSIEGIGLSKGNSIISANKALLNIFGYNSLEEFVKIPLLDHVAPESRDMVRDIMSKRQKGLMSDFSFVYKIQRKDGKLRDLEISGTKVQIEGEYYTLSTLRDITEGKRIGEALKENEEKLRLMAETIEDVFWISTPGIKKMIYISSSYEKIYGRDCRSLYDEPRSFLKVVHDDDRDRLMDIYNKFHSLGRQYSCEYRIIPSDGKLRWISERGFPVCDEYGDLKYMTGVCTDITSHKIAKNELEESEARYRELFKGINNCVAVYEVRKNGEEFIFKDMNSAGEQTEQVHKKDVIGKDVTEIFPGIKEFGLLEIFQEVWHTGKPQHYPVKLYKDERITGWRENYVYKLSSDEIVAVYEDITERKKIEESILQYQQQLKSLASQLTLTEEKERYRIATAIHDQISQYLAVSRIKLDELKYLTDSEEAREKLEQVSQWLYHAIEKTRSLTSDLSSPILYELGFERAVAAWLNDEIQKKHNIKTKFYSDGLPKKLDDDIRVLLFRNVRELLFNIVKHAHAKKVKVSIITIDSTIKVTVEDDGVGFDPDDAAAKAVGDTKFGLFSIRERLEHFGGHLHIDSGPGKGSRISLVAPLKNSI